MVNTSPPGSVIHNQVTCPVCHDILTFQCTDLSSVCGVGETCKLQLSHGNTLQTECENVSTGRNTTKTNIADHMIIRLKNGWSNVDKYFNRYFCAIDRRVFMLY